jgi:hypothetical protein
MAFRWTLNRAYKPESPRCERHFAVLEFREMHYFKKYRKLGRGAFQTPDNPRLARKRMRFPTQTWRKVNVTYHLVPSAQKNSTFCYENGTGIS